MDTTFPMDDIHIYIKSPDGYTETFNCRESTTIWEIKKGIFCVHLHLCYSGKHLENCTSLAEYNIQSGSTLHLVFSSNRNMQCEDDLDYIRRKLDWEMYF